MKIKNKLTEIVFTFMILIVLQSCNNINSDFSDNTDLIESSHESTAENYSSNIHLNYGEVDTDIPIINIDENKDNDSLDMNKTIYYSDDKSISAYVNSIDLSQKSNIEIVVEYNEKKVILPLSTYANSLDDIIFINENKIGITGHINPSLLSHEIFDIDTGELINSFYGLGFIYDEKHELYYIVPQPHWAGIDDRGGNLIMNELGDVLYETEPNVMIYGDLWIESGCIYFNEKSADPNIDNSEIVQKSINIE